MYRYRKFELPGNKLVLCRTEVDGATGPGQYILARALNEWERTSDWKTKFSGSQQGAVMASEIKNNSTKLCRWASQAMLSGVDSIKLGFITRSAATRSHTILSVSSLKTNELGQQIQFEDKSAFGTLKHVIDRACKLQDGKYMLVRDPYEVLIALMYIHAQPVVHIYALPEEEDEEEEE